MAKFTRKPIQVEAVQVKLDGTHLTCSEMPDWLVDAFFDHRVKEDIAGKRPYFDVEYEDDIADTAFEGSWIVLEDGHLLVFTDDEFKEQYEPVG